MDEDWIAIQDRNRIVVRNVQARERFGLWWADAYLGRPCWSPEIREWFEGREPKIEAKFDKLFVRHTVYEERNSGKIAFETQSPTIPVVAKKSYTEVVESKSLKAHYMILTFASEADLLMFRLRWIE